MKLHLRAAGCQFPYGITHCYLPPNTNEHPAITPARQAGIQFTYPVEMEGWVDLGDRVHTEMVYPHADGHPNQC